MLGGGLGWSACTAAACSCDCPALPCPAWHPCCPAPSQRPDCPPCDPAPSTCYLPAWAPAAVANDASLGEVEAPRCYWCNRVLIQRRVCGACKTALYCAWRGAMEWGWRACSCLPAVQSCRTAAVSMPMPYEVTTIFSLIFSLTSEYLLQAAETAKRKTGPRVRTGWTARS